MQTEASFTYGDLLTIVGIENFTLDTSFTAIGVSTDSRTVQPGNIYVALIGENYDGHNFIADALLKGASAAVVSSAYYQQSDNTDKLIRAPKSTLNTLGAFAWHHRRRYHIPVIAIGGAAGKTSTKELVAHVLSRQFNVLKTSANYNNQIGTPLTLLELTSSHTAAVVEIGTNQPGEIELLSAMVQPTHGVITNIGKEHLEMLIDLDGVEKEESTLFEYLHQHNGLCFVNVDDDQLSKYSQSVGRAITFGIKHDADIRTSVAYDQYLHPTLHIIKGEFTFNAAMQTTGIASARNATCAIAIAWSLGMKAADVRHQLRSFVSPETHGYGRMNILPAPFGFIINDTYNANPESMNLALETLQLYPATRRIAVLGDMRELGLTSEEEHMQVLDRASRIADLVVLHGDEFRRAQDLISASNVVLCSTHSGCAAEVKDNVTDGTVVLVKGSRGMQMEVVVDIISSNN